MSSKIERNFFALNLRHYGPQPSIFVRSLSAITTYHIELQYGGDGVSRSWKLPYMGLAMKITVNRQGEILEINIEEKNE
jgi:hypothetical protein